MRNKEKVCIFVYNLTTYYIFKKMHDLCDIYLSLYIFITLLGITYFIVTNSAIYAV